jgi:hypothetical protein
MRAKTKINVTLGYANSNRYSLGVQILYSLLTSRSRHHMMYIYMCMQLNFARNCQTFLSARRDQQLAVVRSTRWCYQTAASWFPVCLLVTVLLETLILCTDLLAYHYRSWIVLQLHYVEASFVIHHCCIAVYCTYRTVDVLSTLWRCPYAWIYFTLLVLDCFIFTEVPFVLFVKRALPSEIRRAQLYMIYWRFASRGVKLIEVMKFEAYRSTTYALDT